MNVKLDNECPRGYRYHSWASKSDGALIGYYCCNCGLVDWHNEHMSKSNLRADWLSCHATIKFKNEYKPVTFAEILP